MSVGFGLGIAPGNCTTGGCCDPCHDRILICFCCPWVDHPEPDVTEPGGPFPALWTLTALSGVGACMRKNDDGTITILSGGEFRIALEESAYSFHYDLNATTYTNDTTSKVVIAGDVISNIVINVNDVDCNIVRLAYGMFVDAGNLCPCFGITYTGTAPDITSSVDCGTPIDCGFGMALPTFAKRAYHFAVAMFRFVIHGSAYRNKSEIEALHKICAGTKTTAKCAYYNPGLKVCMHGKCGCNVNADDTILNKLALRSEVCPEGKWQ